MPSSRQEYGFGRYPNVVTALQFERLLSASGPTLGHVAAPVRRQAPKKIAFLQCVGSAIRTTIIARRCAACTPPKKPSWRRSTTAEHGQCHVFLMDMRAFSKGY